MSTLIQIYLTYTYHYRPFGTKYIDPNFTEMRPRPERTHLTANESPLYEDDLKGKMTYVEHNRKSINEYHTEEVIGTKKKVQTLYD